MKISVDDIKVSERLRQLDNSKVDDLVESIREIGLLQAIVVDDDLAAYACYKELERLIKSNLIDDPNTIMKYSTNVLDV